MIQPIESWLEENSGKNKTPNQITFPNVFDDEEE